jgi:hypothetical protein
MPAILRLRKNNVNDNFGNNVTCKIAVARAAGTKKYCLFYTNRVVDYITTSSRLMLGTFCRALDNWQPLRTPFARRCRIRRAEIPRCYPTSIRSPQEAE